MATLIQPISDEDFKKLTVSEVRKAYPKLAKDYDKLINRKVSYCKSCGEWLDSENSFYKDERFVDERFYMCKRCVQMKVEQRKKEKDPPNETIESTQRMLKEMDRPYLDDVYKGCMKSVDDKLGEKFHNSTWTSYIPTITGLRQYRKLHWEDSDFGSEIPEDEVEDNRTPRKEIKKLFGSGFSTQDYLYLQDQYDDWRARVQVDSKSQETYVIQICASLLDIHKDRLSGKDVTNKMKALDTLMNGAHLQPRQNINNDSNDNLTFGQLIQKWEEESPICEPSPEFKDCDGIRHYLECWFGWIVKAVGFDNEYSRKYEDEINQFKVDLEVNDLEESSEDIYNAVFGKTE